MSTGSIIGAVVGGVIGFVASGYNPYGALYGASLGFSIGMAIDPMTPDIETPGAPDQMTQVMSSEVGTPIPDLAGTSKITGHLLCFGKERTEPVYSTSSGGGNGGESEPEPYIIGYKYYMSWVLGVVAGPATTLYAVYSGEDIVWEGNLGCPASGGKETIVIDGVGSVDFYFGTADQVANSKVGELLDDPTLNTPYRNLCWAFFDDCYIGKYNRTPTFKFMVKKIPEYSFSTKHEIQIYDCNAAHLMWFVLHDLVGLPESWLHSADFATLASTMWQECRGLSVLFDRQQSALNYLETVNGHIDNVLRYGVDGKFHPKLIRDDYSVGDLPLIDEDVMLEEPAFNRRSWINTLNEMKVQYSELLTDRPKPFGPLWGTGYDYYGALGIPYSVRVFTEIDVANPVQIGCGGENTILVLVDGSLWGAGWNQAGQLGIGGGGNRHVFVELHDGLWQKGNGGYAHNAFLKEDGTLWVAGDNIHGQLGVGDKTKRTWLTQVLTGVQDVATGDYHTIAVTTSRQIWGAGYNYGGTLGRPTPNEALVFLQESGGGSNWESVSAGSSFTQALQVNKTLWGTGSNFYGQLGLGHKTSQATFIQEASASSWLKVDCGLYFTIGIKSDGTLWGTGYNRTGQLGLGDFSDRWNFTQVGVDSDWVGVACGGWFYVAFKSDGSLWGAGKNEAYQLGLDHTYTMKTLTDLSIKVTQAAGGNAHTVIMKK